MNERMDMKTDWITDFMSKCLLEECQEQKNKKLKE